MELILIIGLYGSGKTTILNKLNITGCEKLSLDDLDHDSRTKEARIKIIYDLFIKYTNIIIDFHKFNIDYINTFNTQNKSLLKTLVELYSKYSKGKINEVIKAELRRRVLIPSIINYFLMYIEEQKINKNYIIDSGAMHFLSMDDLFFQSLSKFYKNINIIYLNTSIEQVISNLFQINEEHYSFLERGFKKEIYNKIKEDLGIILPNNLKESTEIIKKNEKCKCYIKEYIKDILSSSKKDLDIFIENIKKENTKIELYEININNGDLIENVIKKIYDLDIFNIKMDISDNNYFLQKKPKAIFFDLSSTILDSHKIDLECIDSVLVKYGFPKWLEGTNKKKDKNKSMKQNFSNFFGEKNANQAYQEYFSLLLENLYRMPLIQGIEETLIYCNNNNIKCVIVSNRDKIFVEKFITVFKYDKYFDEIITPETSGFTKPDPRMVKPYIERLNINPNNESILFIGDAYADIRCSYNAGCIPILYTEIIRDEISPQNLKRLSKLNPDNPIIILSKQNELIELLEKSKNIWNKKDKIKITYIGANGKIGKHAINMICMKIPKEENVEIVLIGSGTQDSLTRLDGLVKDLLGAMELKEEKPNINFIITNDYEKTTNSKIVICSAGKWPTKEEKEEFSKKDPSGRLIQSKVNAQLIKDITSQLNKYCPKALFLIVTNQVDMMCHIARQIAKGMNIIGLTGGVDSARLKQNIKDILGLDSTGFMIGYHNNSMIPLIKSIKTNNGKYIFPLISKEIEFSEDKDLQIEYKNKEKEKLEKIVLLTRTIGGVISKKQKTGLNTNMDTGATILPSSAISRLVISYCFNIPHVECYNTLISEPVIAEHYGIKPNTELSIPLRIYKDNIEQLKEIPLSKYEKNAMNEAQKKLNEDLKIIF